VPDRNERKKEVKDAGHTEMAVKWLLVWLLGNIEFTAGAPGTKIIFTY
jgi:hypothetical protein